MQGPCDQGRAQPRDPQQVIPPIASSGSGPQEVGQQHERHGDRGGGSDQEVAQRHRKLGALPEAVGVDGSGGQPDDCRRQRKQ